MSLRKFATSDVGTFSITCTSPDKSADEFTDCFRRFYGPTMNAYEAAEKNGKVEEVNRKVTQ